MAELLRAMERASTGRRCASSDDAEASTDESEKKDKTCESECVDEFGGLRTIGSGSGCFRGKAFTAAHALNLDQSSGVFNHPFSRSLRGFFLGIQCLLLYSVVAVTFLKELHTYLIFDFALFFNFFFAAAGCGGGLFGLVTAAIFCFFFLFVFV